MSGPHSPHSRKVAALMWAGLVLALGWSLMGPLALALGLGCALVGWVIVGSFRGNLREARENPELGTYQSGTRWRAPRREFSERSASRGAHRRRSAEPWRSERWISEQSRAGLLALELWRHEQSARSRDENHREGPSAAA